MPKTSLGFGQVEKLSWNVIDNKSLLFLESLESWNVIEIELLKKGWNVVDNKIVGSPKPLPVSHLKQIACEQIPGMLLVPSDLIERSACCFLADAAGMIKVRHDRRRAS